MRTHLTRIVATLTLGVGLLVAMPPSHASDRPTTTTVESPQRRAAALRASARNVRESDRAARVAACRAVRADDPLEVRSAAAHALYRLGERQEGLVALRKVQDEGAPVREAVRERFHRGRYEYTPDARALFERGLRSEHLAARLDAAAGLLELGERQEEAWTTLETASTQAARFDDRITALAYAREQLPDARAVAMLQQGARDPDERVARTAARWLNLASAGR